MRRKKIWFIVNPVSGGITKDDIANLISDILSRSLYDWRICYTGYAGHGAVLATMAVENDIDVVVAVGGDGTVNEVARSLVHSKTVLGIVPCGSGNGLARHLQIPMEPRKALEMINVGENISIDYGLINNRPFFCTCGMGYDAAVSYKFSSSCKRGLKAYVENALMEWAKYKPEAYTIIDNKVERTYKAFCIALANASQYGNNAYIAPEASMNDGLMDVTVVEPFPLIEAASMAYMLFNGMFKEGAKHIKTFRTSKLTVIREQPGIIHCDGDPMKATSIIKVEMVHAGLKVITKSDATAHLVPIYQTIGQQVGQQIGQQVIPVVSASTAAFRLASQTIVNLFKQPK